IDDVLEAEDLGEDVVVDLHPEHLAHRLREQIRSWMFCSLADHLRMLFAVFIDAVEIAVDRGLAVEAVRIGGAHRRTSREWRSVEIPRKADEHRAPSMCGRTWHQRADGPGGRGDSTAPLCAVSPDPDAVSGGVAAEYQQVQPRLVLERVLRGDVCIFLDLVNLEDSEHVVARGVRHL